MPLFPGPVQGLQLPAGPVLEVGAGQVGLLCTVLYFIAGAWQEHGRGMAGAWRAP